MEVVELACGTHSVWGGMRYALLECRPSPYQLGVRLFITANTYCQVMFTHLMVFGRDWIVAGRSQYALVFAG